MGGGSVMVWAGFSALGKTELAVLVGRQASSHYVYTLSEYLLHFAHRHYGVEFVFQQDNAAIHTSRETMAFFEEQDVQVLNWPARSPDLNTIENLWAIMSRDVYRDGTQYDNVASLTKALHTAWNNVSPKTISSLIDSMPRRCIEVIEKKGNKTYY
jgi:transposase